MPLINTIESALDTDLLTEAEKAGHYYFAFDTSELTRGDFASRMNAYAVALQNNIYQLDEIREREDLPPLNFNYIRLGLDSVLLDPKTREIYTPNTGKLEKMNAEHLTDEQIHAILEARGRHWIKGEHGYFAGSVSDGGSGGGAGGGNISESVDMLRKKDRHRDDITPISDERFRQLTIEAEKNGATILRGGEEIEAHLDAVGADAATVGDVILFRQEVTVSEVLEETHHFMQNKNGLNSDKPEPIRTYLNEIEAKQYLLDNAQKYSVPRSETEQTKGHLKHYQKLLAEYKEE